VLVETGIDPEFVKGITLYTDDDIVRNITPTALK